MTAGKTIALLDGSLPVVGGAYSRVALGGLLIVADPLCCRAEVLVHSGFSLCCMSSLVEVPSLQGADSLLAAYVGSIPGLGSSLGEGKGYPRQCSGLENSMDCIVHGVAESPA